MYRRAFVRGAGVALVAGASGCSGLRSRPGGDLVIRNYAAADHTVAVTIAEKDGTPVVFETNVSIAAGGTRRFEDAFGGGEYAVTATVDGFGEKTYALSVGGCLDIPFYVSVNDDYVELSRAYCD